MVSLHLDEWEIKSGFRIGCFPIGSITGIVHEWLAFPKHFVSLLVSQSSLALCSFFRCIVPTAHNSHVRSQE
jgi:hypothetical protein